FFVHGLFSHPSSSSTIHSSSCELTHVTTWSSKSSSATVSSLTLRPVTEIPAATTLLASPVIRGCQSGSGLPSANRRYAQVLGNQGSRAISGVTCTQVGTNTLRADTSCTVLCLGTSIGNSRWCNTVRRYLRLAA